MKGIAGSIALKQVLCWSQRALFCVGFCLLAWFALDVGDAWIFQRRANLELERRLHEIRSPITAAAPAAAVSVPRIPAAIGPDGLIGRIEIPRIDLSAVVFEAADRSTLRRAVGHIPGTAVPGEPGNAGLAGHRDTSFRSLRNILQNDIITLTTLRGDFRYRVVSTSVVSPSDLWVLDPTGDEVLTLVTCYPFYFVGAAPSRFIVRAKRVT